MRSLLAVQLLQAYVDKRGGKRIVHKILVANNGLAAVRFIRRLREVRPARRPPILTSNPLAAHPAFSRQCATPPGLAPTWNRPGCLCALPADP